MGVHRAAKGLDVPLSGEPRQKVEVGRGVSRVALMGPDYVGMKPDFNIEPGDKVRRGQLLFTDKKSHLVRYTAPGAGTVLSINRGERRALESVVIELNDRERAGQPSDEDYEPLESYRGKDPAELDRCEVRDLLVESGLWTALRARPFGHVANPADTPSALFVTAIDTNPLAPSVDVSLGGREDDFLLGVEVLSRLTDGVTYVCRAENSTTPAPEAPNIRIEEFSGPHPAGLVGYHIHSLHPVTRERTVWHIGYQDAAAAGALFRSGRLDVGRVVAIAGPGVRSPGLVRTRLGASTDELLDGDLQEGEQRVISGSILSGRRAHGEARGYLGRYHNQISVAPEGRDREFIGWMLPGFAKFSSIPAFLSAFLPGRRTYKLSTCRNGSVRAMVPIGMYERVMPMDIMPTFLLRALLVGDVERAEALGALELDEEDLALCTFVCPCKIEYGAALRECLTLIEKEG